ncbi:hypothetical protein Q8791_22935 [Nocardiopsis sp. CT-R113]|uniref:Uncharacterized protein n=1 Tax=Nocardiopsis codii TaxID=3065942 RepID=A0ABU7KCW8_9ACTN|nr:hypothetical protein [Nocardiopsis sp. CT-R113]MEE2040076.1 hypothetical protein [Nocardiopsis sp. CT-R113]
MDETPPESRQLTPVPVPARMPQPGGFVHGLRRFTAWLLGMGAPALWMVGIWHADWMYLWLSLPLVVAAVLTDPGRGV